MRTMQGRTLAAVVALGLAATAAPLPAAAQTISFQPGAPSEPAAETPADAPEGEAATGGQQLGSGGSPIEVLADDGIEWLQNEKKFIARGNASATRGTTTVYGDTLIADYRELPEDQGGGTEVYRLTAEGNVTIQSPQETATGNRSVYEVDDAILYLWGGPAKLVTPTDVVTAEDEIRYYELENKAIAEGNAVAVRGDRKIASDVLTAFFVDPEAEGGTDGAKPAAAKPAAAKKDDGSSDSLAGDSELDRIYADGNVVITTPKEVIEGEQGNYNAKTGIAEVEGSVKITQGKNVLQGDRATSNLNTNVSTLHSGSGGMARGLLVPKNSGEGQ